MQVSVAADAAVLPKRRAGRARGFTLVELLVVIGIIALLMSILLPTLGRVREQAAATQCMSNLRSFGQVLHIYASGNNGRIPLGYSGNKHGGYMIYNGGYQVMAVLSESRLFDAGIKGFYCPSKEDVRWQFNTPENPWPAPGAGGALTRLGMTMRPAVQFSGMKPVSSNWDDPFIRGKFPQLNYFRGKALAAEMFGEPVNAGVAVNPTITSHKKLINVYYEDNSCQAIPTSAMLPGRSTSIKDILKQLYDMKAVPSGATQNEIYLGEVDSNNKFEMDPNKKTGIWHIFDTAK